jgi:hypothetical protein
LKQAQVLQTRKKQNRKRKKAREKIKEKKETAGGGHVI